MEIIEIIKKSLNYRCAVKQYESDFVVPEDAEKIILESLNLAPSSFGLQPYSFLVIKNKSIKEQIRQFGFNQSQFTDSSFLIVFCAKTEINQNDIDQYIARIAEVRNQSLESLKGYQDSISTLVLNKTKEEQFAWSSKQAYIALGFALETAALLEIDATPMEGFDSLKVTQLLNLTDKNQRAIAICSIGKRSDADSYSKLAKVRKEISQIIKIIN